MIIIDIRGIDKTIAVLESRLADEERRIDALLAPVKQDGELKYFSPGDGYWKERWVLQNKLHAARQLLAEFRAMEGKAL